MPRFGVAVRIATTVIAAILAWGHSANVAKAQKSNTGKALYQQYCASCHGKQGKGDGPVAASLATKPTDLTQLAKNAGGTFPFTVVVEAIDGSKPVRAHGVADMPVWGERFQRESAGSVGARADVRSRLMLLADYLQSIQEK